MSMDEETLTCWMSSGWKQIFALLFLERGANVSSLGGPVEKDQLLATIGQWSLWPVGKKGVSSDHERRQLIHVSLSRSPLAKLTFAVSSPKSNSNELD